MVAFPDSGIEPVRVNGEGLVLPEDFKHVNGTRDNTRKVKDQAFTIPRVTAPTSEQSYHLAFDSIDRMNGKKFSVSTDSMNAQAVAKKIAASLRASNGHENIALDQSDESRDAPDRYGSPTDHIVTISGSNVDPEPDKGTNNEETIITEKWYQTILQILVPFLIAGIGTIGAGIVLNNVKNWPVFKTVPALLILVPALLGLKGNLDMCLASRLSTHANLDRLNGFTRTMKMVFGNIILVQIQATVAAVCVALFAMTVSMITNSIRSLTWTNALLLIASSVCTATSSCFILDIILCATVLGAHRININPDNLATPLAASLGDIVSISVLSAIASAYSEIPDGSWTLYFILAFYLMYLPVLIVITRKNEYTREVLKSGWIPVLSALLISGFGGLVLDRVVNVYHGFAVFQPIINGIGGNLVSVQASRTSTWLHGLRERNLSPNCKIFVTPWKVLFKGLQTSKTARILIAMAVIGQLIFVFIAHYMNPDKCSLSAYFVISYLTVTTLQVMFLLYCAHIIIHAMWRYKIDPDNSAIPFLTALGDLSGSLFLVLPFLLIHAINQPYCSEA